MSLYELAILGSPSAAERAALERTLARCVSEVGLVFQKDVMLRDASNLTGRDPRAATAACYFITPTADPVDVEAIEALVRAAAPIIPTAAPLGDFAHAPPVIAASNGLRRRDDDPGLESLAAAMLECVGLLRTQRRVFVSYRRIESRAAALQLHDSLGERGFDVFLDTHDIRPGLPFQEVLWHRLCDSDVLVMLDTPGYFESKWTSQEIGRARAKDIQVLRVIWPEHQPTRFTDIADTIYLERVDLEGGDGPLSQTVAAQVMHQVELLRSRSLAARHRLLRGKLASEAGKVGCEVEAVGPHHAIAVRLSGGARLWAYPVIGVPTAELLHDIVRKSERLEPHGHVALIYDHVGLRPEWLSHLAWLESWIRDVRWIKVSEAAWAFAGLEGELE